MLYYTRPSRRSRRALHRPLILRGCDSYVINSNGECTVAGNQFLPMRQNIERGGGGGRTAELEINNTEYSTIRKYECFVRMQTGNALDTRSGGAHNTRNSEISRTGATLHGEGCNVTKFAVPCTEAARVIISPRSHLPHLNAYEMAYSFRSAGIATTITFYAKRASRFLRPAVGEDRGVLSRVQLKKESKTFRGAF